jgi:hypothetical protein
MEITTHLSQPAPTHASQAHATQHDTWQFHARAHRSHRERAIRLQRNGFVVTAIIPPSYTRYTAHHTVKHSAKRSHACTLHGDMLRRRAHTFGRATAQCDFNLHAHHRPIMRTTPYTHATTHAPRRHMSCSTANGPVHACDVCTHPHHGHCERTIVDPRPVVGST